MAIALVIAAAWCASSGAAGQSLADAARNAEEQRRSIKAASPPITNADLPGEWPITTAGLEQYASARFEVASIRRAHADVFQRLWNASIEAPTLLGLEPALRSEPPIVAALEASGLTAHEYLKREQAITVAYAMAGRFLPDDLKLNETRSANVTYIRNNRQRVRKIQARYLEVERGEPWWGMWRYADTP